MSQRALISHLTAIGGDKPGPTNRSERNTMGISDGEQWTNSTHNAANRYPCIHTNTNTTGHIHTDIHIFKRIHQHKNHTQMDKRERDTHTHIHTHTDTHTHTFNECKLYDLNVRVILIKIILSYFKLEMMSFNLSLKAF